MEGKDYVVYGFFGLIGLLIVGVIIYGISEAIESPKRGGMIISMGYDIKDVDVFLDSIGQNRQSFLDSKGLQKQYKIFADGKSSEFIESAKSKHKSDQANSDGLMTGIVIGSAINSGRH